MWRNLTRVRNCDSQIKFFFSRITLSKNFPSVRIFVFRKTTNFLFTLQARQFASILLQKVLNCTQFSYIWIPFWPQTPYGDIPPYPLPVGTTH